VPPVIVAVLSMSVPLNVPLVKLPNKPPTAAPDVAELSWTLPWLVNVPEKVAATFNAPMMPPIPVALLSVITPVLVNDVSTVNAPM